MNTPVQRDAVAAEIVERRSRRPRVDPARYVKRLWLHPQPWAPNPPSPSMAGVDPTHLLDQSPSVVSAGSHRLIERCGLASNPSTVASSGRAATSSSSDRVARRDARRYRRKGTRRQRTANRRARSASRDRGEDGARGRRRSGGACGTRRRNQACSQQTAPRASGCSGVACGCVRGRDLVHDEDGALGLMCDPLADAPERAKAVQAARADDDEVRLAGALHECGDRM